MSGQTRPADNQVSVVARITLASALIAVLTAMLLLPPAAVAEVPDTAVDGDQIATEGENNTEYDHTRTLLAQDNGSDDGSGGGDGGTGGGDDGGTGGGDGGGSSGGGSISELRDTGTFAARLAALIAFISAPVILIYGAIEYMTSGASVDRDSQGRRRIIQAIVGLGISAIAITMVQIIEDGIGVPSPNVWINVGVKAVRQLNGLLEAGVAL